MIKIKILYLFTTFLLIWTPVGWASPSLLLKQETPTQTVRGKVVDQDSKLPLIGVNIIVPGTSPLLGTSTDENGRFVIPRVPVGRITFQVSYIGYEPLVLSDVLVTSGKELVLDLELEESVIQTEEVVVVAEELDGLAVNEMAAVSARSFSVEQTQRFAASLSDPARMALNFAGVSGGGDDLLNEIVIRGNSPKGILWRLEGIEIPNPNHFGEEGASGGGVSMLSSSTMSRSDFFTGAFPAEYGNATSGVFDLYLRNGNLSRREHTIQVGVLGVETSIEGPFSPQYNGSYLINYRYSTLGILNNLNVLPQESIQYQDVSFKFSLPTKKAGQFTIFGLGGDAQDIYGSAVRDSTQWTSFEDAIDGEFAPRMGIVGASNLLLLSDKTYLKTIVAAMGEQRKDNEILLVARDNYSPLVIFEQDTRNWAFRGSVQLNHKFNARHNLRIGVTASRLGFNLINRDRDQITDGQFGPLVTFLEQEGTTELIQGQFQYKYRPSSTVTVIPGVHYMYYGLTDVHSIEPRLGVTWKTSESGTLSLGVGLHTRPEPVAIYGLNRTVNGEVVQPHKELDLMKAWHYVAGYDHYFPSKTRLKIEAYYQYLQDVPVSSDPAIPIYSTLNAESIWPLVFNNLILVNEGSGENYGVELTLEKYLENGFYYLFTGSLYDARYTPLNGESYHSRYAGNYTANVLAGKEFNLKKSRLFGLDLRFILAGGNRFTPLDPSRSLELGFPVEDLNRPYTKQIDAYYRIDLGVSYTINKSALTHMIRFDVQNVTGRENVQGFDYNQNFEQVAFYHAGLIPVLSYRVTF